MKDASAMRFLFDFCAPPLAPMPFPGAIRVELDFGVIFLPMSKLSSASRLRIIAPCRQSHYLKADASRLPFRTTKHRFLSAASEEIDACIEMRQGAISYHTLIAISCFYYGHQGRYLPKRLFFKTREYFVYYDTPPKFCRPKTHAADTPQLD